MAPVRRAATLTATVVIAVTSWWSPAPSSAARGPVPTVVTAAVSATAVRVGTTVTVVGSVTPAAPDPRTLTLQFQTATGWRSMGSALVGPAGDYQMRVPTDWYGRHVLRVVAPAVGLAAAGVSGSQTVTVTPRYDPRGRASSFSRFDLMARWDPCTTIGYRTNLRLAPRGSLRLVRRAFRVLHAATGLRFRRLGSTRKVPFSTGPDSSQHLDSGLVVAWSTPRRVPRLAGPTAGSGGSSARRTGDAPWRYVYGGVVIDATQRLPGRGFGRGKTPGALLLHELGHAVGLDHVRATSQVMYPSLRSTLRGRYEAGDLAGLQAVGAQQGCFG